jgi:hypothetical protein
LDDRASIGPRLDPQRRDEWTGINFLLDEMDVLRSRGLVVDDAYRTIIEEYSGRRDEIEREVRYALAIGKARSLIFASPMEAVGWAARARELCPDRLDGYALGIEMLGKLKRFDEADRLAEQAAPRFPELARPMRTPPPTPPTTPTTRFPSSRVVTYVNERSHLPIAPIPDLEPPSPKISWASVAGEFLEEHWQKLISGLAVLLIVVSSTVGASLVLGPLLWSPVGKAVLALVFTALCAGFGLGLAKWGAERAGRVMLATSLIVVPINFLLLGELQLLAGSSTFELGLVAVDAALLLVLARGVVGALGLPSGGLFTAIFFGLAAFNAGATRGMSTEAGLVVFLAPCVIFLGGVAWINQRVGIKEGDPGRADHAYLGFGLLAFAFLAGVLRTGGLVLHLVPALYAVPTMLGAIAGVSTARAVASIEKDRRLIVLFQQGGLTLSALAFALALARPGGPSTALYSGNILAVALLGLALYATSLRATRLPAYLYGGFAALFVAYFGTFYFVHDLVQAVEEVARKAMGYQTKLPMPFKAINCLVFNVGLAWLSKFFLRRWSDDRLARHCHYIGLPLSIAACVFSGFEPKAALICLSGYAALYSLGARVFDQPRLIYLACLSTVGAAFFGSGLMGGSSLEIRSLIASGLGLAFGMVRALPSLKRAGEAYRAPLIHSARVMVVVAMTAATIGSLGAGIIGPASTLAFLLAAGLALLDGREAPRVSVYLLAIVGLLGAWLGGYHYGIGGPPMTAMAHGLAVAVFSAALILAGEGLRGWLGRSEATAGYLKALGWAVPVLVLVAWGLAGWAGVDSVTVARTVLVGSTSLLWLTRFRRESVLVYLGLAGLAAWSACLCGLVIGGGWGTGRLESGLAITMAGVSLLYWGAGEWARRRDSDFYNLPCFGMGALLAVGASVLAVEGRVCSVDVYRWGVAAMLAGATTLALIGASRRWPASVALATGSAVGASYLALLSQGSPDPKSAWVLGFMAALESIACRGVGWSIRRGSRDADSAMARPLDFWAFALVAAAIPFGYQSPETLLAVAAASLLLIGAFPSSVWLYGTSAALAAAAYQGWLSRYSGDGMIPFVVAGAYTWWALAVVMQRYGPRWLGRLGLPDLGLHVPLARMAVVLALVAGLVRFGVVYSSSEVVWASLPWLPWSLALFCLLMLRLDPERRWVHLAVGLSGVGYAMTVAPWVQPGGWLLSSSMALACSWWLAGWGASRVEATVRRRLGIAEGEDSVVLRDWSIGAYGLAGVGLIWVVLIATFAPTVDELARWADVLVALGLAGLYIGLEERRFGADAVLIGLEAVGLLAVWWLGASASPMPGPLGGDRVSYLPFATAAYAVLVATLGRVAARRLAGGVVDLSDPVERPRRVRLVEWTSWLVLGLGLAVVYFSIGPDVWVAAGSLLVVSLAMGLLALGWARLESAILGGITWCLTCAVGLMAAARWSGLFGLYEQIRVIGIGFAVGLFGLWWVAGWARRRATGKGGEPVRALRVASAYEWVAIAATVPTTYFALIDGDGDWLGLGVLFALASFFAMVAWRWASEWPAYLAQGFLLACYFRGRPIFAPSGEVDALILATLAYLDLGISELMARLRWRPFARPTLRFALALPLVPILQAISQGRRDGLGLMVLLATSGFYALAAFRLRSKVPAYASAVLLNAFLWLAWDILGWQLADYPQFYLIPVGFTTILLAEVNRQELGRSAVNGLRNLGLMVIYASLAAPIWQAQSFGAWLGLLVLSLVGIFAGIALRVQSFLWLGLVCFVLDVIYQLGRLGVDHALARWGVMLTLGVALILFVALNEKKRIVATLRGYYDEARTWE